MSLELAFRRKPSTVMVPHVAQSDLPKRRSFVVCLVVCISITPLLFPVLSLLHADDLLAPTTDNDADGDLVVNTIDIDDDNDGIPDVHEITPEGFDRDSDRDGIADRLDLDSDNDGILDWQESGALQSLNLSQLRKVGGRLVGSVGTNGLLDVFESPIDTGRMSYALANTDPNEDDVLDYLDLDSDNDGWPDLQEAGVSRDYDADRDGRIDAPPGTVGADGIADFVQRINDRACCDIDGDGADDIIPRNTDLTDLPDFQDLDSDNDGVFDIIELGGTDADEDGHVDNFVDTLGGGDGMDDGLLAFAYQPTDVNGNGVLDHVEFVNQADSQDHATVDLISQLPQPDRLSDPEAGVVRTGLNASGCSVGTAKGDQVLFLVLCFNVAAVSLRQLMRRGWLNK